MLYRLYTTTEDKIFDDFIKLIEHIENTYGWLRSEFSNGLYNLYDEKDTRIGYYKVIL